MPARWSKVGRDLLQHKTRSALAVMAIAIGLFGFGSLLATYSILTRELNSGYLATNPASATLWVDRIDARLLDTVRRIPGLRQTEQRAFAPWDATPLCTPPRSSLTVSATSRHPAEQRAPESRATHPCRAPGPRSHRIAPRRRRALAGSTP